MPTLQGVTKMVNQYEYRGPKKTQALQRMARGLLRLILQSTYRWYILWLEALLGSGTASKDVSYLLKFGVFITLQAV